MSNKKDFVINFDERSNLWETGYDLNMFAVRTTITYVCDMFRARGYLFAREVYERLGLPFTKESITAGWHSTKGRPMFGVGGDEESGTIIITFSAEEDIRDCF